MIGQVWRAMLALNAYRTMITIGTYRNSSDPDVASPTSRGSSRRPAHSASNAPSRRAISRYTARSATGTIAYAAANGMLPATPWFRTHVADELAVRDELGVM